MMASTMSFARAAARQLAFDAHQHVLRLACEQRLRGQHVLDLAGADAERQRAERAVRGGVRIAADDRHAGQRRALLRADHVHDALAQVVHPEIRDAVAFRSWRPAFRPAAARSDRRCRATRSVVGTLWSDRQVGRRRATACARPAPGLRTPAGWSPRAPGGGRCRAARCRRLRCGRRARPTVCRRACVLRSGTELSPALDRHALPRRGTGEAAGAAGRSCIQGRRSSR